MQVTLPCECGQQVVVTEGMAGLSVSCPCGRSVRAPSLGEMRQMAPDMAIGLDAASDPTEDNALLRPSAAVLYAAVVAWSLFVALPFLVLLLVYGYFLAALGFALLMAGHVWLFTQVYVGNPGAALAILLVPFFGPILGWKFVVDHWVIAKWPLVCQIAGAALMIWGSVLMRAQTAPS